MTDALSISQAAREAPDQPAIITASRTLTFADCAAAIAAPPPSIIATPTIATVLAVYAVTKAALDEMLRRCVPALDWIGKAHADNALPLLRLPEKTSDLDEIKRAAARLRAGASESSARDFVS